MKKTTNQAGAPVDDWRIAEIMMEAKSLQHRIETGEDKRIPEFEFVDLGPKPESVRCGLSARNKKYADLFDAAIARDDQDTVALCIEFYQAINRCTIYAGEADAAKKLYNETLGQLELAQVTRLQRMTTAARAKRNAREVAQARPFRAARVVAEAHLQRDEALARAAEAEAERDRWMNLCRRFEDLYRIIVDSVIKGCIFMWDCKLRENLGAVQNLVIEAESQRQIAEVRYR
jgi:hypothetical protein